MFDGVVSVRPACLACGQDFTGADTGDGFAVPSLILIGALVVSGAFWVDRHYTPPLWVHAVLWPPITIGLVIALTRYIKSFLVVQQYRTRRQEMGG